MINISSVNFKADTNNSHSIFNNSKSQTPIPYDNDAFELQLMDFEKQMQKKQKRKERLETLGVYGTIGIAGALIGGFLLNIYGMVKGAKGSTKQVKVVWEDMTKKENFPSLSDDCVNKKVREFIQNIKDTSGLTDDVMKRAGVDAPEQCMIMWGPSGTGKTFSAKMLAKEIGAEYSEVQFADVSSPFVGQTSVEIQTVFKNLAQKAKKNPNKKFLVAFNEIDALLVPREKCGSNNLHLAENRTAFLNGLDQIKEFRNIKIVGTTNVNPDSGNLDKASLSRFGNILKIDLPDEKEIIASLKFHLNKADDIKNSKFFEDNKAAIKELAKELKEKRYAHRDIEDIAKKSLRTYAINLNKNKSNKFDVKLLNDAVKTKGNTVGAIGDTRPAWEDMMERIAAEQAEISQNADLNKKSFWKRLFGIN